MDFKTFYLSLSHEDRKRFAKAAGTTTGYIAIHLVSRRKIPHTDLMSGLSSACKEFGGLVSHADLLGFFYPADGGDIDSKAVDLKAPKVKVAA